MIDTVRAALADLCNRLEQMGDENLLAGDRDAIARVRALLSTPDPRAPAGEGERPFADREEQSVEELRAYMMKHHPDWCWRGDENAWFIGTTVVEMLNDRAATALEAPRVGEKETDR